MKAHTKTVGPAVHFVSRRSPWHTLTGCVLLFCATDADFLAFKQQVEGDPELLPSAEVQLDLKEQARKALAGQLASNSHQHTMSCQACTIAMIGTSHHSSLLAKADEDGFHKPKLVKALFFCNHHPQGFPAISSTFSPRRCPELENRSVTARCQV